MSKNAIDDTGFSGPAASKPGAGDPAPDRPEPDAPENPPAQNPSAQAEDGGPKADRKDRFDFQGPEAGKTGPAKPETGKVASLARRGIKAWTPVRTHKPSDKTTVSDEGDVIEIGRDRPKPAAMESIQTDVTVYVPQYFAVDARPAQMPAPETEPEIIAEPAQPPVPSPLPFPVRWFLGLLRFFNLLEPERAVLSISKIWMWGAMTLFGYVMLFQTDNAVAVLGAIAGLLSALSNYTWRRYMQWKAASLPFQADPSNG